MERSEGRIKMDRHEMELRVSESQGISLIYALTCGCKPQGLAECVAFAIGPAGKDSMCGGRDRAQYLLRSRVLCLERYFHSYNLWVADISFKIKGANDRLIRIGNASAPHAAITACISNATFVFASSFSRRTNGQ
jgi:hypothetical protein